MIKLCMPPAILLVLALAPASAGAQAPAENPVVRLDPALDALVSPDAKLERVATGFGFTEGNIWVSQGKSGYMLFSDIPANVIYKMTPDGKSSIHMEKSGYTKPDIWRVGFIQTNGKERSDPAFEEFPMIGSNGLALDRQGRLIIATWAGRSIDRIESNGKRTVLADSYDGKRFGGTNDVVVKKDGAIYLQDTEIEMDSLGPRLAAITANKPDTTVYVRADKDINYGVFAQVLAELQSNGITKIGLVNDSKDANTPALDSKSSGDSTPQPKTK